MKTGLLVVLALGAGFGGGWVTHDLTTDDPTVTTIQPAPTKSEYFDRPDPFTGPQD